MRDGGHLSFASSTLPTALHTQYPDLLLCLRSTLLPLRQLDLLLLRRHTPLQTLEVTVCTLELLSSSRIKPNYPTSANSIPIGPPPTHDRGFDLGRRFSPSAQPYQHQYAPQQPYAQEQNPQQPYPHHEYSSSYAPPPPQQYSSSFAPPPPRGPPPPQQPVQKYKYQAKKERHTPPSRSPSPSQKPAKKWKKQEKKEWNATCTNCHKFGHKLHRCGKANGDGFLDGCPQCKTNKHRYDQCQRSTKKKNGDWLDAIDNVTCTFWEYKKQLEDEFAKNCPEAKEGKKIASAPHTAAFAKQHPEIWEDHKYSSKVREQEVHYADPAWESPNGIKDEDLFLVERPARPPAAQQAKTHRGRGIGRPSSQKAKVRPAFCHSQQQKRVQHSWSL
ncbi:uncharacterized protein PAC_14493 [Phialocephala subalpina]|uniref:Uncharacterized protein n=1 Tax=Phialocephala subalpina TaxID=576137 RepID=A0A1L7XHS4_9HELO|nr:uncharacterized protein PAC_14493 [Phialocephala subalpina]